MEEHPLPWVQCREVFSWGINDFGMLGNGTTSYATEPERVEGLEGVVIADVAAGGWHSMAISTEGGEALVEELMGSRGKQGAGSVAK